MALEFPDEPNIEMLDDQYMLGESLLVAPVIGEGKRSRPVYFPRGTWYAFDRPDVRVEGPGFTDVKAPLEKVPLFVREGSIIPRYTHHPQHLKGGLPKRLGVDLYPGRRRTSVSYTDEDTRFSMSAGTHGGVIRFTMARVPVTVTVSAKGLRNARVTSSSPTLGVRKTSSSTSVTVEGRAGISLSVRE
jgi:alpha-glucosidase (family GH31 glycosyl hydrolase)